MQMLDRVKPRPHLPAIEKFGEKLAEKFRNMTGYQQLLHDHSLAVTRENELRKKHAVLQASSACESDRQRRDEFRDRLARAVLETDSRVISISNHLRSAAIHWVEAILIGKGTTENQFDALERDEAKVARKAASEADAKFREDARRILKLKNEQLCYS